MNLKGTSTNSLMQKNLMTHRDTSSHKSWFTASLIYKSILRGTLKSVLFLVIIPGIALWSCAKGDDANGPNPEYSSSSSLFLSSSSALILSSSSSLEGKSSALSSSSAETADPDVAFWVGNSPVLLTEIDPNNLTWTDHLGYDPGWVELYNPSAAPVNLKGFSLVENLKKPRKWVFGDETIPAHSYRTVFCSKMDLVTAPMGSEELGKNRTHTNWKLEKEGGVLYLLDSLLGIRDSLAYPAVPAGMSWGSLNGLWGYLITPTPEQENVGPQYAKISETVSFSQGGGFFSAVQVVSIPAAGGTVRCTQDGSEPTENSPVVTEALTISQNTVLRCASFEAEALRSPIQTQTYWIGETLSAIPVFSIAVDPVAMFDTTVGIYMPGPNAGFYNAMEPTWNANFYKDTSLQAHVEYYGRDHELKWESEAGLSLTGNWSRMFAKKSVSLKFSENFGVSALNYPLFPSHPELTKFKGLILRNGGNNFELDYIRDALQAVSTEGLGIDYQKSDYALVFFNGVYYGIYNLREKMNEDYVETNYDIDDKTVDLISLTDDEKDDPIVEVSNGSRAAWDELVSFLSTHSVVSDEDYATLKTMVDVENYANYVGSEIYFRNTDWPGNNVKMWRTHSPASPFKFMLFDTDHGFGFPYASGTSSGPSYDMFNLMECSSSCPSWPNPVWSTLLYRKLMENPTWKPLFINRLATMLSYWFTPERMVQNITDLMNLINAETARDLERWNDRTFVPAWYPQYRSRNERSFASELENIKSFAQKRPAYMRDHMRSHFDLGADAALTLSASGPGSIQVHGMPLPTNPFTGNYFSDYGVEITASPVGGARFMGWSDGELAVTRVVVPGLVTELSAVFQ